MISYAKNACTAGLQSKLFGMLKMRLAGHDRRRECFTVFSETKLTREDVNKEKSVFLAKTDFANLSECCFFLSLEKRDEASVL